MHCKCFFHVAALLRQVCLMQKLTSEQGLLQCKSRFEVERLRMNISRISFDIEITENFEFVQTRF